MNELVNTRGETMDTLLAISKAARLSDDWMKSLDEIIQLTRKIFLFDNVVLYNTDPETRRLEVLYARATGRGKSAEADVFWGETIANHVAQNKGLYRDELQDETLEDRLQHPFILGVPLNPCSPFLGCIIFIRFGGPRYSDKDCSIAELASQSIGQVVNTKLMGDLNLVVERQRSASRLQEEFIHTISHELRSPLGFIKGYVTTLLREDMQWDQQTKTDFLQIIDRETNNLQDLINDLLDSARLQTGQLRLNMQMVRVDSIIRDEINRNQQNHPDLKCDIHADPDIPAIEADPRRLSQVIENLISNSMKYAPGSPVHFEIHTTGETLVITVNDEGQGIGETYLPQIFTRFFRSPEQSMKARGTGLGLFICKQIIEQHNGSITVASPPGSGAVFTINLPLITKEEKVPEKG